jgi:hypothetical protein
MVLNERGKTTGRRAKARGPCALSRDGQNWKGAEAMCMRCTATEGAGMVYSGTRTDEGRERRKSI